MATLDNITVICMSCKAIAPYTPPDLNHSYGIYHWHQPCPKCGANNWASHDVNRDLNTGRLLVDPTKGSKF